MAPTSETDDENDAASSDQLTEETTGDSLPTLPFEIVAEILSRLPVKLLMQLQSVCKSWNSLISDSKFAKNHLRVSTTRHRLVLTFINTSRKLSITDYPLSSVFTDVTATATQLNYPLNDRNRFDVIVGSCHGILCFALDQRFALLWNPSIRKFSKLPSLDIPKREGSYTIYGFGYDHFSDSYKVVAVNCFESDSNGSKVYKTEVKVYTLGTDCWRRIQDFPSGVPFDGSGTFVSGTINWFAAKWIIVSFDLEKETYQELLQPDYGAVTVVSVTLGVLRDCLCILAHSDTFSDVWLMKEYGNKDSWAKLFCVPYIGHVGSCLYTKALYLTDDDQVLLKYQAELVVYNSRDGTFKTLEIQNINRWMVPEVYQESLISPCF